MKKRILIALVGVLALGTALPAQDRVSTRTTKVGKQTTTTFTTVTSPASLTKEEILKLLGKAQAPDNKAPDGKVPPVEGKRQIGDAWAKGVVLEAHDWLCGRCFTDETGRRWCLVYGVPYSEKPPLVSGWIIQPENNVLHFFTVNGRLYRLTAPGVVPGVPAVVLPRP